MLLRFLAVFYLTFVLFGCDQHKSAAPETQAAQSQQPNARKTKNSPRVVSLAPNLTQWMYQLGIEQYLVGAAEFSDFPEPAKNLPRTNSYSTLFKEQLLELKPDIALVWSDGIQDESLHFLALQGIEVIQFESQTLAQIYNETRQLEQRFELDHAQSDAFSQTITALKQIAKQANASSSPRRVVYISWTQPLITLGRPQLLTEVLPLCGAENLFSSVNKNSFVVNTEAIIEINPDLILSAKETQLPAALSSFKQVRMSGDGALFRANLGVAEAIKTLCQELSASGGVVKYGLNQY
ncbi:MAG: helical backbone metal receptor [Pseudomonadota bacterium]|nr:helical backbone metal receptor [Pseudomonadota bacterium]